MDVSVIISVHNGARFLEAAMDSLVGQSLRSIEILVMDDASSDETSTILDRYAARDDRVRVFRSDTNLGLPAALNRLLAHAQGTYAARMDADDVCEPHRLEAQLTYLESHPEVGVVGSRFRVIDDAGAVKPVPQWYRDAFGPDAIRDGRVPIPHPTAFVRRSLFDAHGGYDPRYRKSQDLDLWSRFYAAGVRFAILDDPLLRYRIHDGAATEKGARAQLGAALRINLTNVFRRRLRLSVRGYAFVAVQAAYLAYLATGLDRWLGIHRRIRAS